MQKVPIARLLEEAFRRRFSKGAYAAGRTDYYEFEVVPLSDDGHIMQLHVCFKRGEAYCCAEPGCHFGFWTASEWKLIRDELSLLGIGDIAPLVVHKLKVTVQEGALLGLRFPGDSSNLKPASQYSYEFGPFREAKPEILDSSDE